MPHKKRASGYPQGKSVARKDENRKPEMAINLKWPTSEAAWLGFVRTTGLLPEVAARALYLAWWVKELGGVTLELNSAYRSQTYQLELQRRWDRGDRIGLTSRPATSSLHSSGRAFDVGIVGPDPPPAVWEAIGRVGEALDLRWGGRFADPDPVHFDH